MTFFYQTTLSNSENICELILNLCIMFRSGGTHKVTSRQRILCQKSKSNYYQKALEYWPLMTRNSPRLFVFQSTGLNFHHYKTKNAQFSTSLSTACNGLVNSKPISGSVRMACELRHLFRTSLLQAQILQVVNSLVAS